MTHDAPALAGRLSQLVQVPTVTPPDGGPLTRETTQVFSAFHALLRELYPTLFATAEVTTVGRAGLLLGLSGTGVGTGATALGTVLLMAHQDVVPAPTHDWEAAGWTHPPFAGVVEDGADGLTVYGRGTLDDKGALLTLLEAVEDLLGDGWHPHRDLYLLLGSDEEVDGPSAVAAIAELERRGVTPVLVVDEGGAVTTGVIPGLTRQVAVVGVAEKGVVNLEVSVSADPRDPAHSSTPPRRSVTAALGRAIAALERHPHPAVLDDIAVRMFADLAPTWAPPSERSSPERISSVPSWLSSFPMSAQSSLPWCVRRRPRRCSLARRPRTCSRRERRRSSTCASPRPALSPTRSATSRRSSTARWARA